MMTEDKHTRRLKRKLKKLPKEIYERLKEGEKIYFLYRENFPMSIADGNLLPPYVIVTNYRVIVADPNFPSGLNFIDFPWEEIILLKFSKGMFFGGFEIKDEKGNERRINWLEKPEPFFELERFCVEKIQEIAIENPTIHESGRLWWRWFEIQRSPESGTRTKLQIVNSTTEGMPADFAYAPNRAEPEQLPSIDFETALKIVNDEAETISDKIIVAKKLYENGVISREVYEKLIKEITGSTRQEAAEKESSSEE